MYRSYLLSIISGLLFAVAWPTYGFPILLFFAFVPLLLIERQFSIIDEIKHKGRKIFLLSFISFYLWNFLTYFWLSKAHPQSPTSAELGQAWFAFGFASVVNTLLMSLVFMYFHKIRNRHGNLYGYTFFVVGWFGLEKLHLNWDFAWPWLNLGNGFASYHEWIQWYEITGSFGGTLWVLLVNLLVFFSLNDFLSYNRKRGIRLAVIAVLTILIPIALSIFRYHHYEEKGDEIFVGLIQPKLNPYTEKYTEPTPKIVGELVSLMGREELEGADLLITPETSFPGRGTLNADLLNEEPSIKQLLVFLEQHQNTVIIAGVDVTQFHQQKNQPNARSVQVADEFWANPSNGTIQLAHGVTHIPIYNKSRLVVGVEMFPYSDILKPILGDVMLNFGGSVNSLTVQDSAEVFYNTKNKAKVAPIICYESIFGEYTSQFVKKGANLISVSTNDSWWGNSEGHRQLLEYAKIRAIENRRGVVRAANSGVSAIINQRGDIVKQLEYDVAGVLSGNVKINENQTYYSKFGDVIARIFLLILGILLGYDILFYFMKKK